MPAEMALVQRFEASCALFWIVLLAPDPASFLSNRSNSSTLRDCGETRL
jgi:hypothetical protein